MSISLWGVGGAIFLLLSSFILYPLLLLLSRIFYRFKIKHTDASHPPESLSFIIAVHNAEGLIVEKIKNIEQLDFGSVSYEIIIYLDGCTDNTFTKIQTLASDKIQLINEKKHFGKITGLNKAVSQATGEILIFTDADAILEQGVVSVLLEHFKDPLCGGVCGLRAIKEKTGKLGLAQHLYITVDSYIKKLESYLGNITSNDGKLYAIRRDLFKPIADAVTDDLYACLNITEQHYRFVFEPKAIAHISTPSRHSSHEYTRRRRIVTRSLNGIWLKRRLLNPLHYGLFSFGLLLNKIFRRLIGFALLLLFVASYFASADSVCMSWFFLLQIIFYLLACTYPVFLSKRKGNISTIFYRLSSVCWYFCLGNYATSLGVIDFLSGKRVSKWIPKKHS